MAQGSNFEAPWGEVWGVVSPSHWEGSRQVAVPLPDFLNFVQNRPFLFKNFVHSDKKGTSPSAPLIGPRH